MSETVSKLNEYAREALNSLSDEQRKMLRQGKAVIKEWGDGEYEYVSEVEDDGDGQKKYRNKEEQKNAMHKKQVLARRKKKKKKQKTKKRK